MLHRWIRSENHRQALSTVFILVIWSAQQHKQWVSQSAFSNMTETKCGLGPPCTFPSCWLWARPLSRLERCAVLHVAFSLLARPRLSLEREGRVGCEGFFLWTTLMTTLTWLQLLETPFSRLPRTAWDLKALHQDYLLYHFINMCFSVKLLLCCISVWVWQPGLSSVQLNFNSFTPKKAKVVFAASQRWCNDFYFCIII